MKNYEIIKKLRDGSIAGLMISLAKDKYNENTVNTLKDLKSYNIPVLMFDRISYDYQCDKVYMDNFKATFDCVKSSALITPDSLNSSYKSFPSLVLSPTPPKTETPPCSFAILFINS